MEPLDRKARRLVRRSSKVFSHNVDRVVTRHPVSEGVLLQALKFCVMFRFPGFPSTSAVCKKSCK